MNKLIGVLFALAVAIGVTTVVEEPAQADSGTVWLADWQNLNQGKTLRDFEGTCNCTGHQILSWYGDKYGSDPQGPDTFKVVQYDAAPGFPDTLGANTTQIRVQYRWWNNGWHANFRKGRGDALAIQWVYY